MLAIVCSSIDKLVANTMRLFSGCQSHAKEETTPSHLSPNPTKSQTVLICEKSEKWKDEDENKKVT